MFKPKCPQCTGNIIVKNGRCRAKQRYLCKICNKSFNLSYKNSVADNVYKARKLDGLTYGQIELRYGISKSSAHRMLRYKIRKIKHN